MARTKQQARHMGIAHKQNRSAGARARGEEHPPEEVKEEEMIATANTSTTMTPPSATFGTLALGLQCDSNNSNSTTTSSTTTTTTSSSAAEHQYPYQPNTLCNKLSDLAEARRIALISREEYENLAADIVT